MSVAKPVIWEIGDTREELDVLEQEIFAKRGKAILHVRITVIMQEKA